MKDSHKSIGLRKVVLFILFGLIVLGVCYKCLEWRTFKTLAFYQQTFDKKELETIIESNKNGKETLDLFVKIFFSETEIKEEEQLDNFNKLDGKFAIYMDNTKHYLGILKSNRDSYEKLRKQVKLMGGKRGELGRKILNNQIDYYGQEIEAGEEGLVSDELLKSLMVALKDMYTLLNYEDNVGGVNEKYSTYFSDIASLEKYSEKSFQYKNEDKIKKLHPYGYEVLDKYKRYLGTYYEVVKDFVGGDEESATYKYAKLQEEANDLNIDYDRFFSEREEENNERKKKIIELVRDKIIAIKDYKEKGLGVYPLGKSVSGWVDDLSLCQIYAYKAELYMGMANEEVKSETVKELLELLKSINPRTDELDSRFNKDVLTIKGLEEEEDYLVFECKDSGGEVYPFEVLK
jgi:hypothetical protein